MRFGVEKDWQARFKFSESAPPSLDPLGLLVELIPDCLAFAAIVATLLLLLLLAHSLLRMRVSSRGV